MTLIMSKSTSNDNKRERRRFERLECTDLINYKDFTFPDRGQYEPAQIKDISGGGLQIETKRFISEKTVVKLEMKLSDWQRYSKSFLRHFGEPAARPLVALAEVIRCKAVISGARYEVALAFSGIDERQRQALLKFIKDHLPKRS